MLESNNRNANEKTRTQIHELDVKDRDAAQESEMDQVRDLQIEFRNHCLKNAESDLETKQTLNILLEKIESLLWLNDEDTKPIIKQTVIDSRGKTWLSIQIATVLKWVGMAVAILTAVWISLQINDHFKK